MIIWTNALDEFQFCVILVALGDDSSHQIISIYVHDGMITFVADIE
jgi:hypothetical protein